MLRNADWRVKVLHLQNLEMIARGETIEATTDRLCHQIEKLLPGVRCSVLRVDGNGLLHPLPGSSFPNEYMALLEGLMIGPLVGSCGSAAYLGKAVAAKDIATDPRWVSFKEPVLALGLKACWSSPICDAEGAVLGTFALYFPEKRGPTPREEKVVASCTSLCAIALERHRRVIEREHGAYVDALTNLPNRASLDVALERLSCIQPSAWAVLIIDLDNLKTINDTFGHAAGDALLQAVASRLAESLAPNRVFRMGGDEFVVVLQRAGAPAGIESTARHILDTLGVPADCDGHMIAAQCCRRTLYARLEAAFGRENVPLKHIILEVTESVYLGQREPVVAREIKALRAHGLRVALDDFGTGFASLTHLLTVPVDIVKIDKSFIDRLVQGDPSLAIVEGLVGIAHKLDIQEIAEGIENEAQAVLLAEIGCQLGQGYLFSQAVPRQIAKGLLKRFGRPPAEETRVASDIANPIDLIA